jgi:uncharacterized protein (DUF488 family)
MKLFTVGYEGHEIENFCKKLKRNGIRCVADLRKNPVSRKKGFSKNKLRENLQKYNIEFVHFGGLGVPTLWRNHAKQKLITRKKMFFDYKTRIIPKHLSEIEVLRVLMRYGGLALLCYERDALDCHRHFVSEKIKRLEKDNISVVDLIL